MVRQEEKQLPFRGPRFITCSFILRHLHRLATLWQSRRRRQHQSPPRSLPIGPRETTLPGNAGTEAPLA